jgi:predicted 3-demethylubiquinone-9 3-methyltransferase (glyoxalase superfamily)
MTTQKIMPCLWFDDRIEEAAKFYTSVFPDAKITEVSHYGDTGPMPKGRVMTVLFELAGQQFMALNGGPMVQFNEAVSFFVTCKDQKEVDYYWDKLTAGGGAESQCGWLKDKFGLSWQIVPEVLPRYIVDKDKKKAQRTMEAMLKMRKIDVAAIERAHAG